MADQMPDDQISEFKEAFSLFDKDDDAVSPGWKQTLLALKKEKVFTAIESEDSPMSTSEVEPP